MTTQVTAYPLIGLGSAPNDGTGDAPLTAGQKLNTNTLMLGSRGGYPYAAPSIVSDGDSKGLEPIRAMQWCQAMRNLDVKLGLLAGSLSVGGSNTGSSSTTNLTSTARLATLQSTLAALNAAGTIYDYVLKIGTNDTSAGITPSQTIANIRKVHEQYLRPNGCRFLWLIAVDPRVSAAEQICSINNLYRRYAQENPYDVIFIDTTPYLLDPNIANTSNFPTPYTFNGTGAGPLGCLSDDGLHLTSAGFFAQWPAFDAAMQRVYRPRYPRNMAILNNVASATLSPFSNQLGTKGRTTALGGTDSTTKSGTGTVTGTPMLGFTMTGTLTGDFSVAFSQANIVQAVGDNHLGPGTWPGVNIAFTGTPTADTTLTFATTSSVSPTGGAAAIGDVVGSAWVARLNALTGLGNVRLYNNQTTSLNAAHADTPLMAATQSPLGRGLPAITALMTCEADGLISTSTYSSYNTTFNLTFPANTPISGSITLLDLFYGKFGPIPASA